MKFKIGDRVKVVKCKISGECCENINKISTITQVEKDVPYPYMLKDLYETFSEDELELVRKERFTKADLKDGDIVTYRNGFRRLVNATNAKIVYIYNSNILSFNFCDFRGNLTNREGKEYDIVKVERATKYEMVFERKEEILDEVEKKYLADVIRPFRQHIMFISKTGFDGEEFLKIDFKRPVNSFSLPFFKKNSMYKGMKVDQKYTLEELGL